MDYWEKLKMSMSWVKETIDDKRIIGAEILIDVYTWIDSDYTVHSHIRSHTGGAISIAHGVFHTKASV